MTQTSLRTRMTVVLLFLMFVGVASASHPTLCGTFIQDWLVWSWTDLQWQRELASLKEVGMEYIIFSPTAYGARGLPTYTLYPTKLESFVMRPGWPDLVEAVLRNAQVAGFKVFLGLNLDDEWWQLFSNDADWLFDQIEQGNLVATELYELYKGRYPETFHGWYWVWEVENLSFRSERQKAVLAQALSRSLDHLTEIDPSMPMMLSPFMNYRLGTPDEYAQTWKDVFAQSSFRPGDIFAPMDSLGGGGTTLDNLQDWIGALKEAVDTKPGLRFWVNVETFVQEDWTAKTIGELVAALKGSAPYAEKMINFAYPHYHSPNIIKSGFHQTYLQYVQTGELDSTPPSPPENLRFSITPDGKVRLVWDPAHDDMGIAGYQIYQRGRLIARTQIPRYGQAPKFWPFESYIDDTSRRASFTFTYGVQAYDFAGNLSEIAELVVTK